MTGLDQLRKMNRPSRSGYELTVCMHYTSRTSYCWELIRYPVDPSLDIEIIEQYYGMRWEEIAHHVRKHLQANPDDGFIFE